MVCLYSNTITAINANIKFLTRLNKVLELCYCKVVSLWSMLYKPLTPTEENYAQIENNLLSIVFACEKFDVRIARTFAGSA